MELALVRHAEPDRPEDQELRRDPGLSTAGREQARALAHRLRRGTWSALYASPQRRASETAAVIADVLGLEPRIAAGLAEFDYGRPYIHLEDLMRTGNDMMAAFRREDFSAYGTDAETIRHNSIEAIESIIAEHPGKRVVVVTHGAVINSFVGSFLGSKKLVFHHPTYTGVTQVMASRRGDREITCLNDSTHLRLPWPALCEQEMR
ncbi:histidine phosphatase family protein [Rhodococcus sp. CX]|uniref:histidine phosphatase family protein n=1 Tax=Rhodococcus sp. CX TaxID=2789880 RepID=UPI0018CCD1AE|nr:histidine phosphatase family protein [Rhodococcus sp. CX]MBH0122627.1 histidine phosphatase family protein [Rhodococcus sp. CX]